MDGPDLQAIFSEAIGQSSLREGVQITQLDEK